MKKVKTIHDLRLYKVQLKAKLTQSEQSLTYDWNYLRANAKKLIWRQINPFKDNTFIDGIISALQPALMPLAIDLTTSNDDGKSNFKKVLLPVIKYILGTLGLKWLRSFVQSKNMEEELPVQDEKVTNIESTINKVTSKTNQTT